MGLFNRNQSKKSSDKKNKTAVEDDVISSLLSEPSASDTSKGVNLGFDDELDAGLAKFKKAQANPSEEDQFAQAMAEDNMLIQESDTFNFGDPQASTHAATDMADYDAFPTDGFSVGEQSEANHFAKAEATQADTGYGAGYEDTAPYFIEDHRNPYTQTNPMGSQAQEAPSDTLPSVTKGELASPQRARLSSDKPATRQTAEGKSTMATRKTRQYKSLPATQTAPETRYGIADAIKLLRQLPETGDVTVLMTIVKRTLETAGIRISDIIDDAQRHRRDIHSRVQRLEVEIHKLETQMQARTTEINNLTSQLTETEQVQELLELAEMPAPTQFELEDLHQEAMTHTDALADTPMHDDRHINDPHNQAASTHSAQSHLQQSASQGLAPESSHVATDVTSREQNTATTNTGSQPALQNTATTNAGVSALPEDQLVD